MIERVIVGRGSDQKRPANVLRLKRPSDVLRARRCFALRRDNDDARAVSQQNLGAVRADCSAAHDNTGLVRQIDKQRKPRRLLAEQQIAHGVRCHAVLLRAVNEQHAAAASLRRRQLLRQAARFAGVLGHQPFGITGMNQGDIHLLGKRPLHQNQMRRRKAQLLADFQ